MNRCDGARETAEDGDGAVEGEDVGEEGRAGGFVGGGRGGHTVFGHDREWLLVFVVVGFVGGNSDEGDDELGEGKRGE